MDSVYRSFGADPSLNWRTAERFSEAAFTIRDGLRAGIVRKEEIFSIAVSGIPIGDLIYDTYLRYYLQATVDLADDRFWDIAFKGIKVALVCEDYFSKHHVVAYLAYDAPYIESGVVHRFAIRQKVPVYVGMHSPFAVHEMDNVMSGDPSDHTNWPFKTGASTHDRRVFAGMTADEQSEAKMRARQKLEARLSGAVEFRLLPRGDSAFAAPSSQRILKAGPRPKVLILLHDFCDAPNVLRWSLFEDFWEWLHFLLSRAVNTDFEWYVKPHPMRHFDDRKAKANQQIVESFKAAYPSVKFLEPSVSNRQIIEEGVAAMFTVHGTAGHEFAYLGIPVVNAGYNHHINYNFNIHARSRVEYEDLIARADSLSIEIDKAEIEEFFYTHFLTEFPHSDVSFIPQSWENNPDQTRLESTSEIYSHFVAGDSVERDGAMKRYLDTYFSERIPASEPKELSKICN